MLASQTNQQRKAKANAPDTGRRTDSRTHAPSPKTARSYTRTDERAEPSRGQVPEDPDPTEPEAGPIGSLREGAGSKRLEQIAHGRDPG